MEDAGRLPTMAKNSFSQAMQQIENEFDSKRAEADRLARRGAIMARVRKTVSVLLLLGIFGLVYAFRGDIQGLITAKLTTPQAGGAAQASSPKSAAAATIQGAQENAKTRDALIDGLAK